MFPDRVASDLLERACWEKGYRLVAGLDEAGRGPLAGEVVAAAVVVSPDSSLPEVADSKLLTEKQRQSLIDPILHGAEAVAVGWADAPEIEQFNILEATRLAMARALKNLHLTPDFLLIDGLSLPRDPYPQMSIIKGDRICRAVAAASVIAKVFRDALCAGYDLLYPEYGFGFHKGYATPEHLSALQEFGPCPIHRRTFKGVKELCLFSGDGE